MSLINIVNLIFSRLDWKPTTSSEAKAKMLEDINSAYRDLQRDVPHLFFEGEARFSVRADTVSEDDDDTLTGDISDFYVWNRDDVTATLWSDSANMKGRILRLEDENGEFEDLRIMDVWQDGAPIVQHISTDRPFPDLFDGTARNRTAYKYRIFEDRYLLPGYVLSARGSLRLYNSNVSYPLEMVHQRQAEEWNMKDTPENISSGDPSGYFKRGHVSLTPPTLAPAISADSGTWTAGEPGGTFEYAFAWAHGDHEESFALPGPDTSNDGGNSNRREPKLLSALSPISSVATAVYGASGIKLSFPDINYMLGYGSPGSLIDIARYQHSGIKTRIYRRRLTFDIDASVRSVSAPNRFFLLAEIHGYTTTFSDLGTNVPDFRTPWIPHVMHRAIGIYPRPDSRFEMRLRCKIQPPELRDDNDYPLTEPAAIDMLISRAMYYALRRKKDYKGAQMEEKQYYSIVSSSNDEWSNLESDDVPTRKSRVRYGRGKYRRRYFSDFS